MTRAQPRPYSRRALLGGIAGALALPAVLPRDPLVVHAADPALATFMDAKTRITLRYPGDWMMKDVDTANGELLNLVGPGIAVSLDRYSPSLPYDANLVYQRDGIIMTGTQYHYTFGDRVGGQIGGEPAGGMRYAYIELATPTNIGVVTTWLVDHGGTRFRLRFDDDYDRHSVDIDKILASVAFPPIALTSFTDPKGIFTLQYPQYWKASKSTGADANDNVLQLDEEGLRIYVDIFDRSGTLDDAIVDYRARYPDSPDQYHLIFDPPRDVLIGGRAGRSIAVTSQSKEHPEWAPYVRTGYFVDHAEQRLRFETGDFGGAHVAEILAMMQSVMLLPQPYAVFTDDMHRVAFQYPRDWTVTHPSRGPNTFTDLTLTGKNVTIVFFGAPPTNGLDDTVQGYSETASKPNADGTPHTMNEARTEGRVGNEPAKVLSYRYRNDDGGTGTSKIWVVDHAGQRYTFQGSNYEVGAPEIDDLIASVSFAAAPLTTFTGPQGRVTLQYPADWTVVPPMNPSTTMLLSATMKYSDTASYVNFTVSEFRSARSLDEELAAFRDRTEQNAPEYDFTFDPPQDARIGGEPARTMAYSPRMKGTSGPPGHYRVWILDHHGYRYGITFGDTLIHGAEIGAILDSIRFM